MSDLELFFYILAGVAVRPLLPIARAILERVRAGSPHADAEPAHGWFITFLIWVYQVLLVPVFQYGFAAVLVAFVVLVTALYFHLKIEHWFDAVFFGLAFNAILAMMEKYHPDDNSGKTPPPGAKPGPGPKPPPNPDPAQAEKHEHAG